MLLNIEIIRWFLYKLMKDLAEEKIEMAKKNRRPATRRAYILMRLKKYSFEERGYPVTGEHDIFTHQTKYTLFFIRTIL